MDQNGFYARWKVQNLNRNYPQAWIGNVQEVSGSAFGVKFFLPVDEYLKSKRAVKYALLFIALTFVALFLSEVLTRTLIHPVQYTLIGFALVIFYLMLLSLSEHMLFDLAYIVSSIATIALITLYLRWITRSKHITIALSIILVVLYAFLYVTLQLQDYALLIGSLGLFLILMMVMYLTRKVDWFVLDHDIRK
ncbi:MAG: inner membrane CreD family protein [bacterium]